MVDHWTRYPPGMSEKSWRPCECCEKMIEFGTYCRECQDQYCWRCWDEHTYDGAVLCDPCRDKELDLLTNARTDPTARDDYSHEVEYPGVITRREIMMSRFYRVILDDNKPFDREPFNWVAWYEGCKSLIASPGRSEAGGIEGGTVPFGETASPERRKRSARTGPEPHEIGDITVSNTRNAGPSNYIPCRGSHPLR